MPQHASAKRRVKTNDRDRARNRAVKSVARRATQEMRETIETSPADAESKVANLQSVLDKASKKGVLPKRTVDRRKSRLARAAHKAASAK